MCNDLDLIWRSLLEEDVGVDGTIEIALGEFPTGKIIGAQVKSGMSYIRSESETSFRFYPDKDDLDYWRELSVQLFLLIHHPGDDNVYLGSEQDGVVAAHLRRDRMCQSSG